MCIGWVDGIRYRYMGVVLTVVCIYIGIWVFFMGNWGEKMKIEFNFCAGFVLEG